MKKILFFASALAGLFLAASCQQESLEPEMTANRVSYTIQVPGAMSTKVIGAKDADIAKVNQLVYEVYRTEATTADDHTQAETWLFQKKAPITNGTATVDFELVNNQNFRVLFWAQCEGNGVYTIPQTNGLKNVTLSQNLTANAENYAAFAGSDFIKYGENISGRNVTLVRPIAQLNIATAPGSLSIEDQTTVKMTTTGVTVKGLSTSYNVSKCEAGEIATTEFEYAAAALTGLSENTLTVNGTAYDYVAMNYVGFAEQSGSNVEVSYTINTENVGTISNTIKNVPVKANYRTNIIGNLITSMSDYTITLDAEWEDPDGGNMEVVIDGLVKNVKGDYEISNTAGLAYAINNLMVDNQGAANAATFYIYPGTYDLSEYEIKQINVTSGTLKVYKSIPVVTRSTNDEVIIIGLEKALISEVADGATVLFSGITIQDFEGTGAALVADNKGKVVLSDCEINEDGTPDEDTPLVSGNKPENVVGDDSDSYLVYTAEQLAAAFADNEVESIGLGADIAVENTLVFPADRKATLDLRGWNLTIADPDMVANTYAINNFGDLTIKDSYGIGAVTARGIYNGYDAEGNHSANAKITIVSGTFNAMGTNGGAAVYNYGVADITGGKFESNGGYGLNNQGTGEMTIDNADVRGGVYNVGTLTVDDSKVYQHLSGKHCIYNWKGSVTINGGEFDSASGNELILADGENASVTINDGTFHKTAKSWLYGAATGKNITFTINGGTHYGYVNQPEMTVDTFRPYDDPIVVTGGSYNFDANRWCDKDYKAVKKAETAMWDVVEKVYVAQAGEEKYESLQEAVENATNGATITFLADIEQVDGVLITDKNLTVDLNDKTFTVSEGANTNNRNFKINGSSVVTIKNGTMIAAGKLTSGAYGTVRTEGEAVVNLETVRLYSYRGYGLNVKANTGTKVNIKDSEIYSQYSGGVEAAGGEIELTNVKIEQSGVYSGAAWCSVAIGVNGGGKVTVNSGDYYAAAIATDSNAAQATWVAYVMSSGGTLDINGGTFTGVVAETASAANACGLICADRAAVVNIYDGIFNSNGAILDMRNNAGTLPNPVATLYGGNFSADPRVSGLYSSNLISVAEGMEVKKGTDGRWTLVKVQQNNEIWYTSDEMKLEPTTSPH